MSFSLHRYLVINDLSKPVQPSLSFTSLYNNYHHSYPSPGPVNKPILIRATDKSATSLPCLSASGCIYRVEVESLGLKSVCGISQGDHTLMYQQLYLLQGPCLIPTILFPLMWLIWFVSHVIFQWHSEINIVPGAPPYIATVVTLPTFCQLPSLPPTHFPYPPMTSQHFATVKNDLLQAQCCTCLFLSIPTHILFQHLVQNLWFFITVHPA